MVYVYYVVEISSYPLVLKFHIDNHFRTFDSAYNYVIKKNIEIAPESFKEGLKKGILCDEQIMSETYEYARRYYVDVPNMSHMMRYWRSNPV
jgi:hypothetical protein